MKTLKLKLLELFSWKSVSFLDPQHAQMLDHFLSHSSPDGDCFHLLLWVGGALYCVFLNQGYLFLPSIFDKFFILDDVKLSELYKRMWHFRGQNILWPLLHIFRRSRLPQPPGSTPCWGKVYDACVWSCMIHGSETWLLKKNENKLALHPSDEND